MRLIAHRGNVDGYHISETENAQSHLQKALDKGFDVEVDLWVNEHGDDIKSGHNAPTHILDTTFIHEYHDRIWYHAKNFFALEFCLDAKLHVFWQQDDHYSLTSKGFIWHHNESKFPQRRLQREQSILTITSHPLNYIYNISILEENVYAICSPFVWNWREFFDRDLVRYEKVYYGFLKSGMFWEFFPNLSGMWENDVKYFPDMLRNKFGEPR